MDKELSRERHFQVERTSWQSQEGGRDQHVLERVGNLTSKVSLLRTGNVDLIFGMKDLKPPLKTSNVFLSLGSGKGYTVFGFIVLGYLLW